MPGLLDQSLNRRNFLGRSIPGLGALGLIGGQRVARAAESSAAPESVRLALLSDTHVPADPTNVYRGFRPWANTQAVARAAADSRPSAAILCGDAARLTGEIEDYRQLKDLLSPLASAAPVFIGLGNHDNRTNFYQVFPEGPDAWGTGKHVTVLEFPAVRVMILDSLLYVNRVAGLLGKAQRTWLEHYLPTCDQRATVLFVHHTLGEGDGDLLDVDRLFRLLKSHPKVKAIFYGHSHVYGLSERQGVRLINLPAVGYNFNDSQPVGWIDATFSAGGIDLTLHAIGGNRSGDGLTETVRWQT